MRPFPPEAIEHLDKDCAFLKPGGVFADDMIDSHIGLKWEEVHAYEHAPYPIEHLMHHSI